MPQNINTFQFMCRYPLFGKNIHYFTHYCHIWHYTNRKNVSEQRQHLRDYRIDTKIKKSNEINKI